MKSTHTQSRKLEGLAKPSRRHLHNVVAVLAVLAGLAVFGGASAATAQNAAELNTQLTGCLPQGPEGSWLYTVTIPGYTFQGIETYASGGGYTEADQLSFSPIAVASAGHGAWEMTGKKTFVLTYLNLTFDGFSTGNPTGTLKVRQTTTIGASGNSYTGSGDYTYYDLDGNPIPSVSGTFTITAKRILVQAPK
ncbi:exported hypothetical protein [Candidatus Sulfotelmatomonas gaucii]|uniref:Lipocalin-like domain-containing protein n=1 Tax=Candidatus Sulfuritelmatomonas gaucii TaxID=2043161 RepID=A0A2N9LSL9_9BACT|nr:exported hypothetical protein [Candidatus Sulfotelmatomonas gaucii]